MKVILDKTGLEEFFKQYATESIKSQIRSEVSKQMHEITREEVKRKMNNISSDRIEKIIREVLKKDILGNWWAHEKNRPTEIMHKIVLEEFNNKVKNVKFDKIEDIVLQEARKIIDEKMEAYGKIIKMIERVTKHKK